MNIIYCRISKGENYQDSSHQLRSCQDFAKAHDIEIDEVIEDSNVSAYSKDWHEREGFSKVMSLAEQGLENLIVFESSRISRQFMQGQNIIDYFTKHNVKVWSVVDNCQLNENELSQLWNSFRYFFNQKSSKENSDRQKSKKRHMKEQGIYTGYPLLWGFKVVDKKEVVDETIAPLVVSFFDTYIHEGSKATMEKYNIASHQILMQKLKNEKYIKIIGEAKFNQVQQIISNRRCNIKNANTKALNRSDILFEGLLYHKHCGTKLTIYRDRKGNPIFRCKNCKGNPNVTVKKSFVGNKLIANLEHEIEKILDNLNHDGLKEQYNSRCSKNKIILNFRINELSNLSKSKEKALRMANTKLERYILEDVSDNMIKVISNMITNTKAEIEQINQELTQKKDELNRIIIEEEHQEELITKILDAKDIYRNSDVSKKKAVLNLLIKKIDVADIEDYDIYLNI